LLVFFSSFTSAAIGVTPSVYELDFEPNLKKVFQFTFLVDGDSDMDVYFFGSSN